MADLLVATSRPDVHPHVDLTLQLDPHPQRETVDIVRNGLTVVRGAEGIDLRTSTTWAGTDWEAPQRVPLEYAAVIRDSNGDLVEVLRATAAEVDYGGDFLMPVGYPTLGMGLYVELGGIGGLARDVQRSQAYIVNRPDPVIVTHGRKLFQGTFTFLTMEDTDRKAFVNLLRYPYHIFFARPGFGFDEPVFLSFGTVTEERTTGYGGETSRRWFCEVTEIARPPAHYMESPPQRMWQTVLDDNADWNVALFDYGDWLTTSGR